MDWSSVVLAGGVATAVMTVLMNLGTAMGMPRISGLIVVEPGSGKVGMIPALHPRMGNGQALLVPRSYGEKPGQDGANGRNPVADRLRHGRWRRVREPRLVGCPSLRAEAPFQLEFIARHEKVCGHQCIR